MLAGERLDGGGDAPAECGEALAAGRNLRRRGKPEVAPRLAVFGRERLVAATLPAAAVLLGQPSLDVEVLRRGRMMAGDRRGGRPGPPQRRHHPYRLVRPARGGRAD